MKCAFADTSHNKMIGPKILLQIDSQNLAHVCFTTKSHFWLNSGIIEEVISITAVVSNQQANSPKKLPLAHIFGRSHRMYRICPDSMKSAGYSFHNCLVWLQFRFSNLDCIQAFQSSRRHKQHIRSSEQPDPVHYGEALAYSWMNVY